MKQLLRRLAWAATICLPLAAQATPVLTVASAHVQAGQTFDIAVSISGVDAASGLGAWQFDLGYDPAVLHANSISEGPFMAAFGATLFGSGVIDDASGLISLVTDAFVDLPPWPAGDGVLAIVSFTALADGRSALALENTLLNLFDAGADTRNGLVVVAPLAVPEPGTALLAALAALLAAATTVHGRVAHAHRFHPNEGSST